MQAAKSLCRVHFPALSPPELTIKEQHPSPLHGPAVAATDSSTAKAQDSARSPTHHCTHESHALTANLGCRVETEIDQQLYPCQISKYTNHSGPRLDTPSFQVMKHHVRVHHFDLKA